MNTLSTFLGRCAVISIGAALSWFTVTNPEVESLAAKMCGTTSRQTISQQAASQNVAAGGGASSLVEESVSNQQVPVEHETVAKRLLISDQAEQRLVQLSDQLKELGASYLLVEKQTLADGNHYRVRCDLEHPSQVKCSLEATRTTPVGALEEILETVRRLGPRQQPGSPEAVVRPS